MKGIDSIAKVSKFDRYYKCALLLTDGFTKTQYGFTVTNLRQEVNEADPHNPIYGTTTKYHKLTKNDEVFSNRIFWPNVGKYSLVNESSTYEKRKDKHDSHNVKGELFFAELNKPINELEQKQYVSDSDNDNDHSESESDSASSSEDPEATTAAKSQRKIEKNAKHRADKNLLKIAFDDNQWMVKYLNLKMDEEFPPTYDALSILVGDNRHHIAMTDFDQDYMQHVGEAKYQPHVYPPTHQIDMNNITDLDWDFVYATGKITDITPSSTANDLAIIVTNVKRHTMILGLYYLAKFLNTKFPEHKKDVNAYTKNRYDQIYYPTINEFTRLYKLLYNLNNIVPAIVQKILKDQPWLAYIMQHCKWMVYLTQSYCAILENESTHAFLKEEWDLMTMNDKYTLLFALYMKKNMDHMMIKYLRDTGLQFLFTSVFKQEQEKWVKRVDQALRYDELWSLKADWKQNESQDDKKEEDKSKNESITGHKRTKEQAHRSMLVCKYDNKL